MNRSLVFRSLALTLPLVAGCSPAPASAPARPKVDAAATLPPRLLRCTVGRALNLDPSKQQTIADIRYEGQYQLDLFLPAIAKRKMPPPDATEPAEPVDPATRIIRDSAGLTRDIPPGFDRVVDTWPDRVEMTRIIKEPYANLVIVSDIDEARGVANIFMTQAMDAATFDMEHVYQGGCRVTTGAAAMTAAATGKTAR